MSATRSWLRLLLRLYPEEFRAEMGAEMLAAYERRARDAETSNGRLGIARLWARALADSLRNGLGERLRPAVAWRSGRGWGRDAELVRRRLTRSPLFTAAVVGTLTVGLGAFAVVYTFVHQVLIAPLPYERPEDLYFVWRDYRAFYDLGRGWMAGTDIVELGRAGGPIEAAAGLRRDRSTLTGVSAQSPQEIRLLRTTPNLLDVLGVRVALGRGFLPADAGEGKGRVVVLTDPLWNRLGADPSILGSTLALGGEPYTVIGVLPKGFEFASHSSLGPPQIEEAYVPFDLDLASTDPTEGSYGTLIRARAGAPEEQVAAAVAAIGRAVDEQHFGGRGVVYYPLALKRDLVSSVRPALVAVGFAGLFLVLVLLVNLASLLLVRAVEREREFAVSRALGANGLAVMRAMLIEGGVLGLAGGVAGALASIWGTRVLVALAPPDLPRLGRVALDWRVGLVVAGVGLAMGLSSALTPAIWSARVRLSTLLGVVSVRGGRGHERARRGAVAVQVALSLVLLTAGGLVVRSFERLLASRPGFDPNGVLTLRVPMTSSRVRGETDRRQAAIVRALEALPGVSAVGATSALPLSAASDQLDISFPGAPGNVGSEDDRPLVDYVFVRPGYLQSMGIRLLAGVDLRQEAARGLAEVLIDQHLASRFFPGTNPLGAELEAFEERLRIVGVVQHARLYDLHKDGRPQIYFRNTDERASLFYAIRTTRDLAGLVPDARAAISAVDPRLAVADLEPMATIVSRSVAQQRVSAVLIAGFSLGALLLAAMGLFGVVAVAVTRRRHELALRLALGADSRRVVRQVVREGVRLVALGLIIGGPGVFAAGTVLRGVLIGISPWDPTTIAAVALGLLAVAIPACWLPARRVTRIDPARTLRQG